MEIILSSIGFPNIHDLLKVVLGGPLSYLSGTLPGTLVAVGLNSLFWLAGLHGGNIVNSIINPLWLMNTDANRVAFQAGQQLPNIITLPFIDNFVFIGGGRSTLALVLLIAFRRKSEESKVLGKVSLVPGIFNINEPAMFGIPIVFNLKMFIPFIITPMVNAIVTYYTMSLGIVAKTIGVNVMWTMPPIISGYLATGNKVSGAVLQLVLIIIDLIIYYPFFKAVDNEWKKGNNSSC